MSHFQQLIEDAVIAEDGASLANLLDLRGTHNKAVVTGSWAKIIELHFKAKQHFKKEEFKAAFDLKNESVIEFIALFMSMTRWALPALYKQSKQLLEIGEKIGGESLEECCRTMNKALSICLTDRYSEYSISRKWGTIYMANLLFRAYFSQNALSLCSNMIKTMGSADLPELSSYPMSDQVTFKYYNGILHFYNDSFELCRKDLEFAFTNTAGLINMLSNSSKSLNNIDQKILKNAIHNQS